MPKAKRRATKKAWKEFSEKLGKYILPDAKTEMLYAVQELIKSNGARSVKDIASDYFLSGANTERLAELRMAVDEFKKEYRNVMKDDEKSTSPDIVQITEQFQAIQDFAKNPSLGSFQMNTLGALTRNKKMFDARVAKENERRQEVEKILDQRKSDPIVKKILINNPRVSAKNAADIDYIFMKMLKNESHPNKFDFREEFKLRVKEKSGIKISKYEFAEIWTHSQKNLIQKAQENIQAAYEKSGQPDDKKTPGGMIMEAIGKIQADIYTGSPYKDRKELTDHLREVVDNIRLLDKKHLKEFFSTDSKKSPPYAEVKAVRKNIEKALSKLDKLENKNAKGWGFLEKEEVSPEIQLLQEKLLELTDKIIPPASELWRSYPLVREKLNEVDLKFTQAHSKYSTAILKNPNDLSACQEYKKVLEELVKSLDVIRYEVKNPPPPDLPPVPPPIDDIKNPKILKDEIKNVCNEITNKFNEIGYMPGFEKNVSYENLHSEVMRFFDNLSQLMKNPLSNSRSDILETLLKQAKDQLQEVNKFRANIENAKSHVASAPIEEDIYHSPRPGRK